MKFLVTGSEGYIGSKLCDFLSDLKHDVIGFDKSIGNDITNIVEVRKASDGVDAVCHMASIVGYPQCDANPGLARKVNIHGTANIVSCAKKVVFTSALSNYNGLREIDENSPVYPNSLYAETKLEAEKRVLTVCGDKSVVPSFSNVVVRFGSLYGLSKRMRDDLLVHSMCKDAMNNGCIEVYQPDFIRPLTNIDDAISALVFFLLTTKRMYGVFNVVSQNITKREIAETIKEKSLCNVKYVEGTDKENRSYKASTEKIRSIGFTFHPDFGSSISKILERYKCSECMQ